MTPLIVKRKITKSAPTKKTVYVTLDLNWGAPLAMLRSVFSGVTQCVKRKIIKFATTNKNVYVTLDLNRGAPLARLVCQKVGKVALDP